MFFSFTFDHISLWDEGDGSGGGWENYCSTIQKIVVQMGLLVGQLEESEKL